MTAVTPSPALVRGEVTRLLRKRPQARAVAIRYVGSWAGEARFSVIVHRDDREGRTTPGERWCRVAVCPSSLAVREALADATATGADGEAADVLVILTPVDDERELGADVLARLAKHAVRPIDEWEILRELFSARAVDARLFARRWLARALLEAMPPAGFDPAPAGFLDLDRAWSTFLEVRFGLTHGRTDLPELLRWTLMAGAQERFSRGTAEIREGVAERLAETAGRLGAAIARLLALGRGADAVPLGLACRALFGVSPPPADLVAARVRLEPWIGSAVLSASAGLAWAAAAEALVRDLDGAGDPGVPALLARGDELLGQVQASAHAGASNLLPSGHGARTIRFANALRAGLSALARNDSEAAGPGSMPEVEAAHDSFAGHQRTSIEAGATAAAAVRLLRWLGTVRSWAAAASFAQAARSYAEDGSFADRARAPLASGATDPVLAAAYGELLAAALVRREAENERFAHWLGGWNESGRPTPGLVPLEQVLDEVVAPVAATTPVLFLVLDGMSFAVFHELASDLGAQGWREWVPAGRPERCIGVTPFPSVTRFARTSLLSGCLQEGGQPEERAGFAANAALREAAKGGPAPVVFHKASLADAGGTALDPEVQTAVADPKRRVIAVVVNAIDDHLLRDDQIAHRWRVETIRPLGALLEAARQARRVVVLASDHGHVLERGQSTRQAAAEYGDRYRVGATAEPGELAVRGSRVLAPGGSVILPWRESLRYGARKNGYHGGAAPQEVLVPIAVIAAGDPLAGWQELAARAPAWWTGGGGAALGAVDVPPAPATPPFVSVSRRARDERQISLPIGGEAVGPASLPAAPTADDWIAALQASARYGEQRQAAGPTMGSDDRVREALTVLAGRGGRLTLAALADATGMPGFRVAGFVAALQRLLNVDGYPVIAVDAAGDTVSIDRRLLAVQFELGGCAPEGAGTPAPERAR